jgi:hypothetical protein
MFKGYNVHLSLDDESLYNLGNIRIQKHKQNIYKSLSKYLLTDGSVDGSELEKDWFPEIQADVFISHSHRDKKLAITLAGWLSSAFQLDAFVDSTIWGYSDDLLWIIDNEYCPNEDGKTFSYEKRNSSTSHVHLMLSTALAKVMNNTECLLFLNTPNSIKSSDAIKKSETNSPWLYYEIAISSLIHKPLSRHIRRKELMKAKAFSELNELERKELQVDYKLKLEHLTKINNSDLVKWYREYNSALYKEPYPLDVLYGLL